MSDQDLALPLCNQMTPPIQSPDFFTKISFYGLSPISAYLSLLLIIGYIKFPSLRERPGDLILGIAISNLVLSIHWTLSISLESLVDNSTGCYASGMVAVFAGFLNYVYSIAFVHYLKQKLQNLLKKSRISNKINVHLLCVILSVAFTAYLIIEAEIGQNLFYTCSKRFSCNPSYIAATIAVIFYLSYEFFAVYLYVFIKRSFRQAISSSGEAKLFLDNYQGYLILSTLLYLGIVLGHIYSEYAGGYNMNLLVYIIPVHNACKVLQGILITIYRYRDPIVRHAMTRLIFFWKTGKESSHSHGKTTPSLKEISIDDGEAPTGLNEPLTSSDHLARSSKSLEQTNIYDSFAKKRKLELTYSVLTSAMISYLDRNDIPEQPLSTLERAKQVLTYEVNENFASVLIPNLKRKLSEAGCQIAPVRMTVIAPSIFKEFVNRDFGLNNILETFDLEANRDKIRNQPSVKGGKSGEFFFYLENRKLLIKSISSKEMSVLLKILGDYYEHIKNNPESLIVRLFGVLKLEWGSQCLNLIIMRNVCPYPEECIERRFDIKGSTYDRTVLEKSSINNLKEKTLKDVDFLKLNEKIKVNEAKRRRIFEALKKDSLFLQQAGLMDYSLMIFVVQTGGDLGQLNRNILYLEEVENSSVPMEGNPSICYHFGVIDLLQTYTMKKRMEKFGKKLINFNPWLDTSAQDCTTYRNRFVAFIRRIFEISEDNICDTEHNEPVL